LRRQAKLEKREARHEDRLDRAKRKRLRSADPWFMDDRNKMSATDKEYWTGIKKDIDRERKEKERNSRGWIRAMKERGNGRRGVSNGGNRITQMPQNPLLGRMAQFGMMASGMAATMFLFQMITAQLQNLMEIITKWEESLLDIIDKTSLTKDNMDDLSTVIQGYTRTLGVAQTGMAEATGAAMQYGISPTQDNINQLYGLNYSENVKDYKEAAAIMNLAGTEFGDKAAASFMNKWDAYAGTGDSSGAFGFEWEKLKSSGKDAMMSIWDDDYGKKMTDSMRGLSDWISNNREAIGSAFDKFVAGLKAAWAILKVITPGVILFLGAFVAKSGFQMFVWSLTSMSKMLGPTAKGMTALSTSIAAMDAKALAATSRLTMLKASLLGIVPAIIAIGVAFAGWKIWKQIQDLQKLGKALKDMENLSLKDYLEMTPEQRSTQASSYRSSEEKLKEKLKIQTDLLYRFQEKMKTSSRFKNIYTRKFEDQKKEVQRLVNEILGLSKEAEEVENATEVHLKNTLKGISGIEITVSWEKKLAALEKINKELGYMPQLLNKMKEASRKVTSTEDIAAMGLGEYSLIEAKTKFKDSLKIDPKKQQAYNLSLNQIKLNDPSINKAQLDAFEWKEIEKYMQALRKETIAGSKENEALTAGLLTLKIVLSNLGIESVTQDTIKYNNAMHNLNEQIEKFDLTDYQKQLADIDKNFDGDEVMKANAQKLLFLKEKKLLETKQGKNPDNQKRIADLKAAFAGKEKLLKIALKDYRLTTQLSGQERDLSTEREKGLGYISKTEEKLQRNIALTKAAREQNLRPIKPEDYKRLVATINALADYDNTIRQADKEITIGQFQTTANQGRISDLEKEATIQKRILTMAKTINDQKYFQDNPEAKAALKKKLSGIIIEEEAIRQLRSEINQDALSGWEQYYSRTGRMTDKYYAQEKKQIAINYRENELNVGTHYAKMVKKEEEYQLALKDRRRASLKDDLSIGAKEALRKIGAEYQTLGEIMEISIVNTFNGISSAMTSWVMGTKNAKDAFKDMTRSILTDLTSMIIKWEIFNMVKSMGSSMSSSSYGWVASIGSTLVSAIANAQGNVVSGIGFYSNHIVDKPTIVPHASRLTAYATGGALFGEAGPEAIMPLTRMPSGNLGVESSGSANNSVNFEINITNNGKDVEASQEKAPYFDGEKWVIGIVLDHAINNKGNFRTSMKGVLAT